MKLLSVCFLALTVFAHVEGWSFFGNTEEPKISSQVQAQCSAFSAIKIRQIGRGSCKGIAGADCLALAGAIDDFQEAYEIWFGEGACDKAALEACAQAVAQACASVYTKTIAQVECTGAGGFACGWSIAEGSSYATALAKAVSQAAVDVGTGDASAFCVADVEAVAGAIAEAAAAAESKACVHGIGSEKDFQEAFVESVAEAVASAFVTATAQTCDATGEAAAKTLCTGETSVELEEDVKAEATEKGKAAGSTGEVLGCDPGMDGCCDPGYSKPSCTFQGLWFKKRDFAGGLARVWKKGGSSDTCQCYSPHAYYVV